MSQPSNPPMAAPMPYLQPRSLPKTVVPQATTHGKSTTNLLSCINCRKRKVKCNKTNPCSACDRSSLACIFPNRARLPRGRNGGSKTTNVELLRRVNKLEKLLDKASGEANPNSTHATVQPSPSGHSNGSQFSPISPSEKAPASIHDHPVRDEAMNRYIGSSFWKSLTYEIESLRHTLNETSDEEGSSPVPLTSDHSNSPKTHSTRVWGYHLPNTGLRERHPSTSQMLILCSFYVRNFDPMFKVLHGPTLRKYVGDAAAHIDDIHHNRSIEALLFAMYYAAVTTMTSEDCTDYFQTDREVLLDRYRSATEYAFANANILLSSDLITLQALVIFLISVRCHDDSQLTWTLIAVAIRLAHSLRLHHEDLDSSFSPYTQELRRRLWWHICLLDIHSAEDRGSEPMIHEATFTTKKPLNINDADLDPENLQPLSSRVGFTEMTFCLICHELSLITRRFTFMPPSAKDRESQTAEVSIKEKISMITDCQQYLDQEYLVHCDNTTAISWVAVTVAQLILARVWLSIYHPLHEEHRSHVYPTVTREMLLLNSVEILESAHRLEREPSVAHWQWFFNSWVQWHALAVALAELCLHNRGPLVERAWAIIDQVFEPWASHIADSRRGMLWRPIQKLMSKALANRRMSASTVDSHFAAYATSHGGIHPAIEPPLFHALQPSDLSHHSSRTDMNADDQIDERQLSLPDLSFQPRLLDTPSQQQFSPMMINHDSLPDLPLLQTVPEHDPYQTQRVLGSSIGHGGSPNTINWAEWDAFMQEFELEQHPETGDQISNNMMPLGCLWLP